MADCIGREWQLGTVQLDYNLPSPQRFGLEYIGADNQPHQPVMIHRAPFGSFERFVGMLIEHFAGAFPLWLAPEQVRVMVVSQKVEEYGRQVEARLRQAGFRVSGDYRAEKIGAKIRDAQLELIPYMFVIGGREAEAGQAGPPRPLGGRHEQVEFRLRKMSAQRPERGRHQHGVAEVFELQRENFQSGNRSK